MVAQAQAQANGQTAANAGTRPPAPGRGVDAAVEAARQRYARVDPEQAMQWHAEGALLIDTRPVAQRARFGVIDVQFLAIERNVLEWRCDPSNPAHHGRVTAWDTPIIVFCQEGFASSLAVASLLDLGLSQVTDLAGGFRAWAESGLPVRPAPGSESAAFGDTVQRGR